MQRRDFFKSLSAATSAALVACRLPNPLSPSRTEATAMPSRVTDITVQTGLTDSSPASVAYYLNRAFIVSWPSVPDAGYYEVRISPGPITRVNWDRAVLLAKVDATGEETVEAHCEVQPEIFPDRCEGCGACISVCPRDAVRLENRKAIIDQSRCSACGQCFRNCRFDAVKNSCYNIKKSACNLGKIGYNTLHWPVASGA